MKKSFLIILWLFASMSYLSAQTQITGKVTDATTGEGLPFVSISIEGTTIGVNTNDDGTFTISVPNNGTLIFSFVGYTTVKQAVGNRTVVNVALQHEAAQLDEVVVTALGIKRSEKALGYSVQKVSGDELQVVKGVNVATNLTGKVAGLMVNNSTEFGARPDILLRGDAPLIVIDGVAYGNLTINDLSPDDIEDMNVLKGSTASALYGIRGRTGAIMITTKRKADGKGSLSVNISNNTMFQSGFLKFPEGQQSYSSGNAGVLEYNSGNVWGNYMDGREVSQYDPMTKAMSVYPLVNRGKDNIKNFLQTGFVANTNINIAQTGDLGSFRISATQIHQKGQWPNTKLDKYIVNAGGTINFGKLTIDANLQFKKEKSPNIPEMSYGRGNYLYNMLIWTGQEYDIRDYKDYWTVKDQKQNWGWNSWYDNPYYLAYERTKAEDRNLFTGQATINYQFLKNLSATFRSGFDSYNTHHEQRYAIDDRTYKQGMYRVYEYPGWSSNSDFIVNGNFNFLKDFNLDLLGGASLYYYEDRSFTAYTQGGLSIPGFYSLKASVNPAYVETTLSRKALYSLYSKASLSWKNGVFIDITGRNDWSSTLPASTRSYFYPSVAGSFVPTQFYNPIEDILSFWKIRASWTMARRDLGVYDLNQAYSVTPDAWSGQTKATYPTSLRDPNVKAETERTYEIGTDFRFLKNRIGLDFTYFNRLKYNRLLNNAPVSDASGFTSIITNTQEEHVQRGIEITLSGKPIVGKDFSWDAMFNFSYNHWYYARLDPQFTEKYPQIKVGGRVDLFWIEDWRRDGAGNIVHQGGLPVKNPFFSVYGNKDPKFLMGFANNFKYKNFDLSFSFDARFGGKMYSWTEQAMWNSGAHPDSDNTYRYDNVVNGLNNYIGSGVKVVSGEVKFDSYGDILSDTRVFDRNDVPVSYQSYVMQANENPHDHQAIHNVLDATFIKLRELSLNYNIPTSVTQKFGMKALRVGVIGQNLWMWAKEFRYSDPDRGAETLNSPSARFLGFNINITF